VHHGHCLPVVPLTLPICLQVLDRAALLVMLEGLAGLAAPGTLRPPAHIMVGFLSLERKMQRVPMPWPL